MKERDMMPDLHRLILHPLTGRIFLCLLGSVYLVYLFGFVRFVSSSLSTPTDTIVEHQVEMNPSVVIMHWIAASMRDATAIDTQTDLTYDFTQGSIDQSAGKANQQQGQPPRDENLTYPLSTVGKVFFTSSTGRNLVCSGTAVQSRNRSVVDTAGHCLYWNGGWVQNVIFCPLYDKGNTPYDCWAARDLEVPSDWINAPPNDYHHDFGMFIVAPNSQGDLTDVVGGAGWAYNQPVNQPFYAYGYPAGYPYDGQTRQSCENVNGLVWQHGGGKVLSIPCGMTGGSSGGPWFIKISGNWYLNGHNDFTSSIQFGHMFSPYYDDAWYALYSKAQQT